MFANITTSLRRARECGAGSSRVLSMKTSGRRSMQSPVRARIFSRNMSFNSCDTSCWRPNTYTAVASVGHLPSTNAV